MELEEFKKKFNLPRISEYVALLSQEQKKWFWELLWEVKQVFPNIDIYPASTSNFNYLGFGIKKIKSKRVESFLFVLHLKKNEDFVLYITDQTYKLLRIDEDELQQGYDQFIQKELNLEGWLDKVKTLTEELDLDYSGEGLYPVDYEVEDYSNSKENKEMSNKIVQPLNRILFGAAGTGKTFNTINHALSIIEDKSLEDLEKEEREDLKNRFDEYKNKGQIKFVTFHQSFSYEDFVEGIRAETVEDNDGKKNIEYPVVSGVFKSLCDTAQSKVILESQKINFDPSANEIWKMSLGRAGEDEDIFDYCIKNDCVLLGWGNDINFSSATNRKQIDEIMDKNGYEDYRKKYPSASRFVNDFKNTTKVGDLIIISDGNYKFRAIGEISGNYELLPDSDDAPRYVQKKSVKWLKLFKPSLNVEQLFDKVLSQQTIYNLANAINITKLKNLLDTHQKEDNDRKFVLIIDEINRGNISRIFGELITLIEESKRQGAKEQLSVTLPYSKHELTVPNNLYIIGTMNSSDRSLTGLDIALRRRFTFVEMPPKPELLNNVTVEGLEISKLLKVMNQRVEVLLDRDHCIGHANFMSLQKQPTLENLAHIFKQKIIPQLQEYFFDDWSKVSLVLYQNGMIIEDNEINISALFPANAPLDMDYSEQKKIWRINDEAFKTMDAFIKILGAKG